MRMFKCDVCGTPFVYTDKQCNYISFRNVDLDYHEKLLSQKSYEICPSCFDKIRNLLLSISNRKVSET